MTYIVNDKCIKCKLMDCVEVCPVDCFYEGDNMLAIKPDTEEDANNWVEHNTKYSNLWPNITKKRAEDVPQDQEKWRGVKDKLKYFSKQPGKGD